jgi:hypothetical protein
MTRVFARLHDRFAEDHDLTRWDLQDVDDAWKLWYTLNVLEARKFDLYMLQYRNRQYMKSHSSFGEYWGIKTVRNIILPYRDVKNDWASMILNKTNRLIKELDV